jgi:hypothetical protein
MTVVGWILFILVLLAIAALGLIVLMRRSRELRYRYFRELELRDLARREQEDRRSKSVGANEKRLEDIIKEKRDRFLNIPNVAFHFADDDQIRNFYNDYFKEPTVASLVSEMTGGLDAQIKGSIPKVLESRIGATDLSKWVSTIKLPDNTLNGMFLRWQRETIKSGQVTLGLEEVDIELSELQTFEEIIATLRSRFDFTVGDDVLAKQRKHLKQKAADRTMSKLEQATGWMLIEGKCTIQRDSGFFRCVYRHPVNAYLPDQPSPVSLVVLLPESQLEPRVAGNYAASVGKLIPLRVYGQVWQPIDRNTGTLELQITPLAVY